MTDQPSPGESHLPPPQPAPSGAPEPPSGRHEAAPVSSAPGGASNPPPPPPGGSYPPPPPSSGGYAPPPPGPAIRTLPTDSYAPWTSRALAFLIDILPYAVLHGIGYAIMVATQQSGCVTDVTQYTVNQYCATQPSTLGMLAQWLAWLAGLVYLLWNYGYRQGTTGSSLGKSVTKIKVVSEVTGQPLGFGMSVLRQIAHVVDALVCFVGFLLPLWDSKRQTLADKIMTTVVLPIEQA